MFSKCDKLNSPLAPCWGGLAHITLLSSQSATEFSYLQFVCLFKLLTFSSYRREAQTLIWSGRQFIRSGVSVQVLRDRRHPCGEPRHDTLAGRRASTPARTSSTGSRLSRSETRRSSGGWRRSSHVHCHNFPRHHRLQHKRAPRLIILKIQISTCRYQNFKWGEFGRHFIEKVIIFLFLELMPMKKLLKSWTHLNWKRNPSEDTESPCLWSTMTILTAMNDPTLFINIPPSAMASSQSRELLKMGKTKENVSMFIWRWTETDLLLLRRKQIWRKVPLVAVD